MNNYGAHAKYHKDSDAAQLPRLALTNPANTCAEKKRGQTCQYGGFPCSAIFFPERLKKNKANETGVESIRLEAARKKKGGGRGAFNTSLLFSALDLVHDLQCVQNKSQLQKVGANIPE